MNVTEELEFFIPEEKRWENWRRMNICFFDLETTGVDTDEDYIVQFVAMNFEHWEFQSELEFLFEPPIPIPEGASQAHGFYDEDVAGKPEFADKAEAIVKFMYQADILCAYNGLTFDYPLLNRQLQEASPEGEDWTLDIPMLDVLVWERWRRQKMSRNTLEDMSKRQGVTAMHDIVHGDGEEKFHEARADVTVLKQVTEEVAAPLPRTLYRLIESQMEYFNKQQEYLQKKYGD